MEHSFLTGLGTRFLVRMFNLLLQTFWDRDICLHLPLCVNNKTVQMATHCHPNNIERDVYEVGMNSEKRKKKKKKKKQNKTNCNPNIGKTRRNISIYHTFITEHIETGNMSLTEHVSNFSAFVINN